MSDLNHINSELQKIDFIKTYLSDLKKSGSNLDKRQSELTTLKASLELEKAAAAESKAENRIDKRIGRFLKANKPSVSFGDPKEKTDSASSKEAE